ncbi:hypothetical protein ANDO1_3618 [plant metagenome]|uniref:Uncharacterized protein n=1 Tax=plant metagenome TaxID=1297885 RepID=A0A484PZD5_9ZZZZ
MNANPRQAPLPPQRACRASAARAGHGRAGGWTAQRRGSSRAGQEGVPKRVIMRRLRRAGRRARINLKY